MAAAVKLVPQNEEKSRRFLEAAPVTKTHESKRH